MTERQLQTKVLHFLRNENIWHVKVWGGGFQRAGVPDIITCVNGYFVAIELKSETGKPTKLQDYNLERINESGGVGIILRPSQFEDFKRWIREVKRCQKPNIRILV